MSKVIKISNTITKQIEINHNLIMIDILIDQYIPEKRKFVKQKIKKEQ